MWWLHFVDGPIPAGDAIYWLVLGIATLWAISASPFRPQDLIEEGENALSEARSYAQSAYSNHDKYVVHHIVAKAHPYAKPARDVLESVGIDPVTNGLNFAIIPERVHKYIHTKKYLFYVNSCFDGLYGDEEAVIKTLNRLEFEIQLYSNTGFKRW